MAAKKKKTAKKGTRKSTLKKRKVQSARRDLFMRWLRRGAVIGVLLVTIGWSAAWIILSEADTRAANWVHHQTLTNLAKIGFRVDNILVEGRRYSDPDILLALVNVKKGDPIFSLKPAEAKQQIERVTWVKKARVERRLPSTVYVHLTEREPIALWQEKEDTVAVIDEEGTVLTRQNLAPFKHLLMIRGDGAPERAQNFIGILSAEAALKDRVDHATLIDERRWDLYLKDGKRIKLPEKDIGLALRNIMTHHKEEDILSKDSITDIDARYTGRLIVRTELGKVQNYKAEIGTADTRL